MSSNPQKGRPSSPRGKTPKKPRTGNVYWIGPLIKMFWQEKITPRLSDAWHKLRKFFK